MEKNLIRPEKHKHPTYNENSKKQNEATEKKNFCTIYNKSVANVKRHNSIHTNEKNYKCDKCPKSYKTQKTLQQHQRFYHSEVTEVSRSICDKIFRAESNLKQHAAIHNDKRPCYACKICGRKL